MLLFLLRVQCWASLIFSCDNFGHICFVFCLFFNPINERWAHAFSMQLICKLDNRFMRKVKNKTKNLCWCIESSLALVMNHSIIIYISRDLLYLLYFYYCIYVFVLVFATSKFSGYLLYVLREILTLFRKYMLGNFAFNWYCSSWILTLIKNI